MSGPLFFLLSPFPAARLADPLQDVRNVPYLKAFGDLHRRNGLMFQADGLAAHGAR